MSRLQTIRFTGDCLAGRGVPDAGTVLYDRDLTPRVLDLVICEDPLSSLHPYLKLLLSTGPDKIVTTCYLDRLQNFAFRTPGITGVVVEIRDKEGRLAYRRRGRSHADDLRAMNDEQLAAFIAAAAGALPPCGDADPASDRAVWLAWLRQESEKEDP